MFEHDHLEAGNAGKGFIVCHKECSVSRLGRRDLNRIRHLVSVTRAETRRRRRDQRKYCQRLDVSCIEKDARILRSQRLVSLSQRMDQNL